MKTYRHLIRNTIITVLSIAAAGVLTAQNYTAGTPGGIDVRKLPDKQVDVHFIAAPQQMGPVTFLGVNAVPVDPSLSSQLNIPEGMGLTVLFVAPGSPAEKAGLKQHDILRLLNDQILIHPHQLSVLVRSRKTGDKITLTILRGGKEQKIDVVLDERDPSKFEKMDNRGIWFERPAMPMQHNSSSSSSSSSHSSSQSRSHNVDILEPETVAVAHDNNEYYQQNFEQVRKYVFDPSTEYISSVEDSRLGRHTVISMKDRNLVLNDDEGTLIVKSADEGRFIIALDKDGEEIFKGTVASEEDRNNLPESVRKRLEKLDNTQPPELDFEKEIEPGEFDILLRRSQVEPETI